MNLVIYMLVFLVIAMTGVMVYALFTLTLKINELEDLQTKTISIVKEFIGLDKSKEIVDCMNLMGRSYIKLSDHYKELQDQHLKVLELINEIQNRYCDSYAQFEHCRDELKEIKALLYSPDKENQNGSENE